MGVCFASKACQRSEQQPKAVRRANDHIQQACKSKKRKKAYPSEEPLYDKAWNRRRRLYGDANSVKRMIMTTSFLVGPISRVVDIVRRLVHATECPRCTGEHQNDVNVNIRSFRGPTKFCHLSRLEAVDVRTAVFQESQQSDCIFSVLTLWGSTYLSKRSTKI